jgi:large subunit ribosomal protein L7/L12
MVMRNMKNADLVTQLSDLTPNALSEVADALAKRLGVNLNAPRSTGKTVVQPVSVEVVQTAFTVTLAGFVAEKKISVIKVLREVKLGTGLAEAKSMVEKAPVVLFEGVTREEADSAKKRLEEAGAQVSVN